MPHEKKSFEHKTKETVETIEFIEGIEGNAEYLTRLRRLEERSSETTNSYLLYVVAEEQEDKPTQQADLKIHGLETSPDIFPTEHAHLKISFIEGEGSVYVPGRFTSQLLAGCIAVACAISAGIASKGLLSTQSALQDWMLLTVVVVQVIASTALAWRAIGRPAKRK